MSTLRTNAIQTTAGKPILNSTGSILQVIYASFGNGWSGTSVSTGTGYFVDVGGFNAVITPSSSSSRIMVLTNLYIGKTTTSGGYQQAFRITRNGTPVQQGGGDGGRPTATGGINMYQSPDNGTTYQMYQLSGVHIDSPSSTSALTYQVQLGGYSGSPVVYLNRAENWQNSGGNYNNVPLSTLTLLEVSS